MGLSGTAISLESMPFSHYIELEKELQKQQKPKTTIVVGRTPCLLEFYLTRERAGGKK